MLEVNISTINARFSEDIHKYGTSSKDWKILKECVKQAETRADDSLSAYENGEHCNFRSVLRNCLEFAKVSFAQIYHFQKYLNYGVELFQNKYHFEAGDLNSTCEKIDRSTRKARHLKELQQAKQMISDFWLQTSVDIETALDIET